MQVETTWVRAAFVIAARAVTTIVYDEQSVLLPMMEHKVGKMSDHLRLGALITPYNLFLNLEAVVIVKDMFESIDLRNASAPLM